MLLPRNFVQVNRIVAVLLSLVGIYGVGEYYDVRPFIVRYISGTSTIDAPGIVSKDLTDLCNQTKWIEGLWLQCHSNCQRNQGGKKTLCGGLNNIRNRVQTCLRLSIATGAGLIIPRTETRDSMHLDITYDGSIVDANVFWDTAYFQQTLQAQCPQLQLRFDSDLTGIDTQFDLPERQYKETAYYNHTFAQMTEKALEKAHISDISATNQVVIGFGDPFIAWNYVESHEQDTIRKDLFESIRYNPNLLSIGSQILQSPELQNGYIGVHLRGESDWPSYFGKLKDQIRLYIEEIHNLRSNPLTSNLTAIYVSCGNQDAISVFREKLSVLGYTVHDKMSLLAGYPEISAQVEDLLFDEKGGVEYQMQVQANVFMGPAMSSMSSLIAYARSINETEDFFEANIYPGSYRRQGSLHRKYPKSPIMKGNSATKLMVVNGDDIMNSFP